MAQNHSRRGAANVGIPLMIVAFLAMAGFLYWLEIQASAQKAMEVVEDTTTVNSGDISNAVSVEAMDLQTDPSKFEGQMVRIAGLSVASMLGQQGFWLQLPNRNPFLVSLSQGLREQGLTVQPGEMVTVIGTIYAMGDSVLTAWTDAGTIGEGDRLAAEFATHFVEAQRVEVTGQAGASADGS